MEFLAVRENCFFQGLVFRILFAYSHSHSHFNVQDLYLDFIIFIVENPDLIK